MKSRGTLILYQYFISFIDFYTVVQGYRFFKAWLATCEWQLNSLTTIFLYSDDSQTQACLKNKF